MTSDVSSTRIEVDSSSKTPFVTGPTSVAVQCLLCNTDARDLERTVAGLARAAELALGAGVVTSVTLRIGDNSPNRCIDETSFLKEAEKYRFVLGVEYDFFGVDLGTAGGHNRLAATNVAEMLLFLQPEVVVGPTALITLLEAFRRAGVGMTEAKQLPIEHPKDYDVRTGECSWATMACTMVPAALFREIGGFDAESFFLCLEDVDYSWRTRLKDYRVIFLPSAVAFSDVRKATPIRSSHSKGRECHAALSDLLLAYKWSRQDLVDGLLRAYATSGDPHRIEAREAFLSRQAAGRLPLPLDLENRISQFVGSNYAKHRFVP